jgi:hypothetical protein
MIVRQEFQELPPKAFLKQILDTRSSIYVFLWEKKDESNRINMSWMEINRYYNKNSFRTSLRKLNTEGLLDYYESDKGISIELVGWDEIANQK